MQFSVKILVFRITVNLLDLDLSDGDIALGIHVTWKADHKED